MKARFEAEARTEYLQSLHWYVNAAGRTVAKRFEKEVRRTVARLLENPMLGAAASHGLRRHPLRRYPYTVYYRVETGILRIIAVAHHSRRPDYWSGRG